MPALQHGSEVRQTGKKMMKPTNSFLPPHFLLLSILRMQDLQRESRLSHVREEFQEWHIVAQIVRADLYLGVGGVTSKQMALPLSRRGDQMVLPTARR